MADPIFPSPAGRGTTEPRWEEAPLFGRRETLLATLKRLWELSPHPVTIVETGTIREEDSGRMSGDGWSTVAWGWYAGVTGSRAYTVDISGDNIAACRRVTAPFASSIEYVTADSVEYLQGWPLEERGPIHLLYLDSYDYFDVAASEAHNRREAEAALPFLAGTCLVLFDDTVLTGPLTNPGSSLRGKGTQAVPYLLQHGFCLEDTPEGFWPAGGQVLLSRSAG